MNKLSVQLSLAFVMVAWLAVGAVALIVGNATESSFRHYVNQREVAGVGDNVVSRIEDFYATNRSWAGVEELLPGRGRSGQGQGNSSRPQFIVADDAGLIVAASDPELIGDYLNSAQQNQSISLMVDGNQVGWLAWATAGVQALGAAETQFLEEITTGLAFTVIGVGLLAIFIGVMLAWRLGKPLRGLTGAVRELSRGQLGRQVSVPGTAEVNELAHAFNSMSLNLAELESLRRRIAANVAHELRTPVSVLRGHLEGMMDGVFPLEPAQIAVAYDQTIHLSRLVDDLRLLTLAEAGHLPLERVIITPGELTKQVVEGFMPLALDANVTLTHNVAPDLPPVCVDVDRVRQVLGNLLTNALRHTFAGGIVNIQVIRVGNDVQFSISNTGDTLTSQQIEHIFDPFWRADESRKRDKGGSGLGLAISRQIVTLHGGSVSVKSQAGQTTFSFTVPSQSP